MRLAFTYLTALLFVFWSAVALAQPAPSTEPDYENWANLAEIAENAVELKDNPSDRLEVLRDSLADWRAEFSQARVANQSRIASLRSQLEALGTAPENGEEPPDVAQRRSELNDQLQKLQAPQRVAQEAFLRADALIAQVDTLLRDRQAERLLSLGASPLNPAHWPKAFSDLGLTIGDLFEDTEDFSNPAVRKQLNDNLPLILLMVAVGLLLLVRGRALAGRVLKYLRRWGGRGTGVWGYLVSLFRIILPLSGLVLLTQAITMIGITGERVDQMLTAIPIMGFFLLGFRWLAERLFSRDIDDALIPLSAEHRRAARFYMLIMSLMFVARGIITVLMNFDDTSEATTAVLAFPTVVVMSLVLAFNGLILRRYRTEEEAASEDSERGGGLARVIRTVGTAMVVIAVISPTMAGLGYATAGDALLYPMVISLALLGFVLTLQRFFADLYVLVTRQGPDGREALIPALIGFFLMLLSLPLLALIWGARVADLTELWSAFLLGFAIGDTRISPRDFLVFAIIFAFGYMLTRLIQSMLRNNVLPKTKIDIGGQNAIVSGISYVGIFLSAVLAVTGAGINLSSLAIVAGALSVGVGFGLRTIVENFVSGIILLIGRPVSEGDWIEVGGRMGYVRDISVRSTRIETFDRTDVIVPNADLVSGTVTNYTRGNTVGRLTMSIGVAYGTDTKKVDAILNEIIEAQPMVLANPKHSVVFANFGADALEFEMRMFLRDVNWILSVKSDVNHAIAKRFAEEEIEVPFAQRDLWLRNPDALRPDAERSGSDEDQLDPVEDETTGDERADDGDSSGEADR